MTISESIIYAMAVLLSLCLSFYACSADASGVSKKQVKRIVNQAITARAPDLRGEPGPQGPPGPKGLPGTPGGAQGPAGAAGTLPFIYARITPLGEVDESRSDGIEDADVRRLNNARIHDSGPSGILEVGYCFNINAAGAQVTMDLEGAVLGSTYQLYFGASSAGLNCPLIVIVSHEGNIVPGGFFITIY